MSNLQSALAKIDKKIDRGMVSWFKDIEYDPVDVIPTGSLRLDYAIGGNKKLLGIPRGRITLLWGPKSAGKSTLCYHAISNAQQQGIVTAIVDPEQSFDPRYATICGVDVDNLLWVRTYNKESGELYCSEEIWEVVDTLAREGAVGLIVIDSLDAMVPRAELDGEWGESHPGLAARVNAQAARKLMGLLKMINVAVIGIRQVRYKIGVKWGNPETMGGGEAWKHAASLRIDLRQSSVEKHKEERIGRHSKYMIRWNKIGPPGQQGNFLLTDHEGVDWHRELLDLGVEYEILGKKGSYYYYDGETLAQGWKKAKQRLIEQPEIAEDIREQIKAKLNGQDHIKKSANGEPDPGSDTEKL
jgi:recombination protein RecA